MLATDPPGANLLAGVLVPNWVTAFLVARRNRGQLIHATLSGNQAPVGWITLTRGGNISIFVEKGSQGWDPATKAHKSDVVSALSSVIANNPDAHAIVKRWNSRARKFFGTYLSSESGRLLTVRFQRRG